MNLELYIIVDRNLAGERDVVEIAAQVIRGGAKAIQLRDKSSTTGQMLSTAVELRTLTREESVTFIVNDRPDVALACDADGVHLGQDDLPLKFARKVMGKKLVGVSTHTLKQALHAQREGAGYISVGPIFSTNLKPNYRPVGIELIQQAKGSIQIPFVAVGGIGVGNVTGVIEAGACNIACCQAVIGAEDVEGATRDLLKIIKQTKTGKAQTKN